MKKTKQTDVTGGPVYKIGVPRRIDAALLDSLDIPKEAKSVRIMLKKLVPLGKFPQIGLPGRYMARLACNSAGKNVKYVGKAVPAAGLEARPPEDKAELKRAYRLARKEYVSAWKGKLCGYVLSSLDEFEKKYLPKARTLIVFRDGKQVGVYILLKSKDTDGKPRDLVAWHNPVRGLSAAERRSFWYQGAVWLNKTAKFPLVVGLDSFDKESLKFFADLGFKSNRIKIERKG